MYQHFPANLDIWVSKKNPLTRKIEMEKGNLTFWKILNFEKRHFVPFLFGKHICPYLQRNVKRVLAYIIYGNSK